ncbi:MAG TPA: pilus assembly protein TadG-related protein [Anaerolineaceae bacterium]|nr:pilus assembly protein TadG-related protein [Anaerolineaceae bacterium]
MNIHIKKHEKGQIVVILVLAFVGILGFVAIAVDGGMIFSDRRYDQNAADASALAGAGVAAQYLENEEINWTNFDCGSSTVHAAEDLAVAKAQERAAANNFTLETTLDNQHGVIVNCVDDDWTGSYDEKYLEVQVKVSSDVNTSFAHLFYNGRIRNTVEAVARIRPRTSMTFGYAIAALREDCPNSSTGGVNFDGGGHTDANVTIFNGGIYSAACMRGNGSVAVYSDTEIGNYYTTDLNLVGGATVSPYPQKATEDLPDFSLDPPNCSGLTNFGEVKKPDAAHPIGPGIYSKITVGNNDDLVMNPGLYCVGAFSISGGTVTGSGVTIYMNGTGSNDRFSVSGGTVNLESPGDDSLSPALKGVLIYMGHESSVNLGGNADSYYAGTVYAPHALIDVGGTSQINPTFSTQLIGDTVIVHGTARIDINFDLSSIFQDPSYVDLYR